MSEELVVRQTDAVAQQQAQDPFLAMIERCAQNNDVETMERLYNLRERSLKADAEAEFSAAMARLQKKLPRVKKNGMISVPGREGKKGHETPYAKFEDMDAICRPLYTEEGFSVSFTNEIAPNGDVVCVCIVERKGCERRFNSPPMPPDETGSKNKVQARKSSSSYGKRAAFENAFNIVSEGHDDDGKATGYIDDEQHGTIMDLIEGIGFSDVGLRKFLRLAGVDSVDHIQKTRYEDIVQALRDKLAQKQREAK